MLLNSLFGCTRHRGIAAPSMLVLALLFSSVWSNASANEVVKHFILGGEPVFENEAEPWIVALAYNNNAELVQRQFCGGSIIADQWVLTAAHCLFDRRGSVLAPSSLTVAINAADLRGEAVSELVVTNIIIHPDYQHDATNPHSDLALLELATSSGIEPVMLSTKPSDELINLTATVSGWGAVVYDDPLNPQYPVQLHSVDVPIVSLDVCNDGESYDGTLYSNQLCAGLAEGGRDSCVGDSGGPLSVTVDGQQQQVGIVSFGIGCALPKFYGVYTDIPYFINWINQYIFVGNPEFEPEQLEARTESTSTSLSAASTANEPTQNTDTTGQPVSNSDVASVNWLLLAFIGVGLCRRRS